MLSRSLIKGKSAALGARCLSTNSGSESASGSNSYLFLTGALLAGGVAYGLQKRKQAEAWIFRDDIGSP